MKRNPYRMTPWMLGAPAHLRNDELAQQYEVELGEEIERGRDEGEARLRLMFREVYADARNRADAQEGPMIKARKEQAESIANEPVEGWVVKVITPRLLKKSDQQIINAVTREAEATGKSAPTDTRIKSAIKAELKKAGIVRKPGRPRGR